MPEPLCLTATLLGTVGFHRYEGLTLDGPLLYHATKLRLGDAFYSARPTNAQLAEVTARPDPTTGLAVYEAGDTWCYCVSHAVIAGDYGTELHHWNKRFDTTLAGELADRGALAVTSKVNMGSGAFKSYHQPLFTEVVARLVWYALGEADRLRMLLPHILGLGKHRNSGEGRVVAWDVAPWDGPTDRWLWHAPAVLARPVPLAMLPGWDGATAYCAWRPPAWLPSHQTLCAVAPPEPPYGP